MVYEINGAFDEGSGAVCPVTAESLPRLFRPQISKPSPFHHPESDMASLCVHRITTCSGYPCIPVLSPFISTHYNYRDHRKILVIDGHTAFNGGVNLSDEYINRNVKFGHWKDTAVMLKGEAVRSFTLMFLQMWGITEKENEFARFLATCLLPAGNR